MLQTQTVERLTGPLTPAQIRQRYITAGVPRVPLALLPTPMHEAPRLARELGIGRLLIKRDDLTGLAFGGNKARNLEFRMAEAVHQGADVFEVRFIETNDRAVASAEMDRVLGETADEVRRAGKRPYVMNHAGAFAVGSALAYLLCTLEIVEQTATLGVEPTHLYMASGNKGHAGLILGRKLLGRHFRTIAISQHYADDRVSGALAGAREALAMLGWHAEQDLDESDVESYDEYVETAYGEPSPRGLEAMRLAARTEGLILDPVYTAKAMAGLIDHARHGLLDAGSTVVFIHTGGLPALFAFSEEILQSLT